MAEHSGRSRPNDRTVRSLVALQDNASTARALNLIRVWKKNAEDNEEYRSRPFFKGITLNRTIIVKHRLRSNERDSFIDGRSVATKVILPIDVTDLRMGARTFFVGQIGYDTVLEELFSVTGVIQEDVQMLQVLDTLPSLDPFLMRERLKKNGFTPARCYFDISDADTQKMFNFVRQEVAPLIGLSFDDIQVETKVSKLASKILANASDDELDHLRMGLGMDRATFAEGMFCWKGFIYYKWSLSMLASDVQPIRNEISEIRPFGPSTADDRAFIVAARTRLSRAIALACDTVRMTLKIYDDAYADLTHRGQPAAFREFLLKAPTLFHELGDRLGAVQHIMSFWRYRFPPGAKQKVGADELLDLLSDFECSLNVDDSQETRAFS